MGQELGMVKNKLTISSASFALICHLKNSHYPDSYREHNSHF